ncbi:MAG: ribosome small subunit-dependent GTPase A [Oscillospiraceae bacterium]|nr:ribosome small subunit-dependent GTPase A [Oscillospiraceae bacterium]
MEQRLEGLVIRLLGGFYYVECDGKEIETRARGVFRKDKFKPCVGDRVIVETADGITGTLAEVLPRKNCLVRPPVANLDQLVLVSSIAQPQPNFLVLDKMIAICQHQNIEQIIVITKADLGDTSYMENLYRNAGFEVYTVCNKTGEGVEDVKNALQGKVSAFCGNSGVGKSSLLNAIDSRLSIDTAHISEKLGRGRHTTRHSELYKLENGGYIADTPGFSAVELERYEVILKDELQYCFREFEEYIHDCRFTGCSHTKEKGCAVLQAVEEGKIAKERHESYLAMYEVSKQIKEWELNK